MGQLVTSSQTGAAERAPRDVICVDLEAALLRTRLADERLLALVRQRPQVLLQLLRWGWQGRAAAELGTRARIGYDALPLDERVIERLRSAHADGCTLVLLSSLDPDAAEAIARRVGIFSRAEGGLTDARKRAFAHETFGSEVVYIGRDAVTESGLPTPSRGQQVRALIQALRVHQWSKNALVLVPVALAGPLVSALDWTHAGLAFLVFGLLASAGYLVNDLLDLDADRRHASKRLRPFAAGALPVRAGAVAIPALTLGAGALCLLLPAPFAGVAGLYFVITLAYSLRLKQEPFLDVIILAALFTIRILAGALLLTKPFSYWLLTFAMFFFLGLATIKRVVELKAAGGVAQLRGYNETDLTLLVPLGLASVVAANVIFVIYLISEHFPGTTYANPEWLWLILPLLLYWPLRLWRVAMHGRMDADPVLFALRDRTSLGLGALVLLLLVLAW